MLNGANIILHKNTHANIDCSITNSDIFLAIISCTGLKMLFCDARACVSHSQSSELSSA